MQGFLCAEWGFWFHPRMLCLQCLEVRDGTVCAVCGDELVVAERQHLEVFIQSKVTREVSARVEAWTRGGVVAAAAAAAMAESLVADQRRAQAVQEQRREERKRREAAAAEAARERAEAEAAAAVERERAEAHARAKREAAERKAAEERAEAERRAESEQRRRVPHPDPLPRAEEGEAEGDARQRARQRRRSRGRDPLPRARDGEGSSVELATDSAHPVAGALAALSELDQPDGPGFQTTAAENVGWFIGALLVLGGSIYGVREAWLAFGPVGRYLSVGGAAFAYHAAFVGLSALLYRRSRSAGRVLAGIGVALLPVAAVSFTHLLAANRSTGALAGVLFVAGAALALRFVARRFDLSPIPVWAAFLPPLAAMLPLGVLAEDSPARFVLALVGVAAYAAAGRFVAQKNTHDAALLFVLAGGAYAASALEVMAITTSELDDPTTLVWRTGGLTFGTWLGTWIVSFGAATVAAWTRGHLKERFERLASVSIVGGLGLASVAAISVVLTLLDRSATPDRVTLLIGAAACALAAVTTVRATALVPASHYLLLPLVTLAAAVAGRVLFPDGGDATYWALAAGVVVAAALVSFDSFFSSAKRWPLRATIVALMAACVVFAAAVAPPTFAWSIIALGALFAAAAHAAAFREHIVWHYVGALAAGVSIVAAANNANVAALAGPMAQLSFLPAALLTGLGAAYSVSALTPSPRHRHAFADLALVLLVCGLCAACTYLPAASSPWIMADAPRVLGSFTVVMVAAVLLVWRAFVDRSPVPSALGFAGFAGAAVFFAMPANPGDTTLVLGAMALAAALVAALFRAGGVTPLKGDGAIYFHLFRNPFTRPGRAAIADGAALVSLGLSAVAVLVNLMWFTTLREGDRDFAIDGGACVILTLVIAFGSRAFSAYGLRGSVATLWTAAGVIAIVAVTNRIGRPLPPHVVALNLSVIGTMLWAAGALLRRYGPALGRLLDNEADGFLYHWIPHVGALALAALLTYDAYAVGIGSWVRAASVTPPLFFWGPALLVVLVARTTGWRPLAFASPPLVILGAGVLIAQGHLVGPVLQSVNPPSGPWVFPDWLASVPQPWLTFLDDSAYLGARSAKELFGAVELGWSIAAIGGALLLLLGAEVAAVRERAGTFVFGRSKHYQLWLLELVSLALLVGLIAAFFTTSRSAALVALIAAIVGTIATRDFAGFVPLALLCLTHADAQARETVPPWTGIASAFVGWLVVAAAELRHRAQKRVPWAPMRVLVALSCWAGAIYAMATGGAPKPLLEGPGVAFASLLGAGNPSTLTLELFAAALFIGMLGSEAVARQAEREKQLSAAANWGRGAAAVAALLSLVLLLVWALSSGTLTRVWDSVAWSDGFFARGALALSVAVLLIHVSARFDQARAPAVAFGERIARDGALLATAALLFVQAVGRSPVLPDPMRTAMLGVLALAILAAVSVHAAWKERSARHLYVVQTAIVSAYGLVRTLAATSLRPEHDALFALCLGFLLLGATVLARRHGAPDVAKATRRFAALLPLMMLFVLPWQASFENALFAAGAGALYSALGWVEHSKIFGTFGAVCVNLGLFVVALWQGARGVEVYFAPFGLFVIALGHLFAKDLPHAGRNTLRFLGSILLYAPAAVQIVMQVGDAADPMYAYAFAGVCLLGIGLGMMLQIRAYLALGTLFLFTDVVAGLVRASQRSQRVGFFVLSATGLMILGGMVFFTVKKAEVLRVLEAFRRKLRTWD